jgi:hypothetical protein
MKERRTEFELLMGVLDYPHMGVSIEGEALEKPEKV